MLEQIKDNPIGFVHAQGVVDFSAVYSEALAVPR